MITDAPTGRTSSYLRSCVTESADVTSPPRLRSTSSQQYERQRTRLSLDHVHFPVQNQEPGIVCRHHCTN